MHYGFTYMISAQILFFVTTIVLIAWFLKTSRQSAKDILDKKLVLGKISMKKYESLLDKISR